MSLLQRFPPVRAKHVNEEVAFLSTGGLEPLESKLQPPRSRPGLVPRTALVDRLIASDAPLIAVVAPLGYGKTTVLAQYADRTPRRSTWVSLDDRDNDPVTFMSYVAAALDRVEPVDHAVMRSLASPGVFGTMSVFPRFASLLSSRRKPFCLVIDHLETIKNQQCLDALVEVALHLPPGSQLVVASRDDVPFPMARLRAQGQVMEVSVDDLAMGEAEARELLAGANAVLGKADLAELLAQTEGWPIGLYLAALSLNATRRPGHVGLTFNGDDRLVINYLRTQVLSRLSPETVLFLRRTASLDQMSGPLCDAVLDTQGSREVLEALERSNLLLVPLDRKREWYRYHHLFRDVLRRELVRADA